MFLSGVEIPPVRLAVALICFSLALILLVVMLVRGVFRRIRFGRQPNRGRGGQYGSGLLTHHTRPSSSNRRYGRACRGYKPHRRRRRVSRRRYGTFRYFGHSDPTDTQNSKSR